MVDSIRPTSWANDTAPTLLLKIVFLSVMEEESFTYIPLVGLGLEFWKKKQLVMIEEELVNTFMIPLDPSSKWCLNKQLSIIVDEEVIRMAPDEFAVKVESLMVGDDISMSIAKPLSFGELVIFQP